MADEQISPETLAALLDGRLTVDERQRLMAGLARGEDSYDNFLETSAIMIALSADAAHSETALRPSDDPAIATAKGAQSASRWRRRAVLSLGPLLVAAGIATVMISQSAQDSDLNRVLGVVRTVTLPASRGGSLARVFGSDWARSPWPAVRGAEAALSPRARAFRMGARFAALQLAFAVSDTAAIASSWSFLAQLAADDDAGAPLAERMAQLAVLGPSVSEADRRAVGMQLRGLAVSPDWFDLGVWSESARLAARGRQTAFFAPNGVPQAELRRILNALDRREADDQGSASQAKRHFRTINGLRPVSADVLPVAVIDSAMAYGGR